MSTVAGVNDALMGPVLLSLEVWTERSIFDLLYIREPCEILSAHLRMYVVPYGLCLEVLKA